MRYTYLIAFFFILASCSTKNETATSTEAPTPEAISFSGKPLYAPPSDSLAVLRSDSTIAAIRSKGELNEEDYISIGQQMISVSRFNDAITNYSAGLEKYPNSFKLLRHRGHRYISIRKLEEAIKDLNKAEELIRDQPDVPEYDATGHETGTYQHWIWYHIGLYYFLNQAYLQAAPAYENCLAASRNNKNIVGSSDWLYNTYMRLGERKKRKNYWNPSPLILIPIKSTLTFAG